MFETDGEYWICGIFIVVCVAMFWAMYNDTHDS